jgi:hypothetical protein
MDNTAFSKIGSDGYDCSGTMYVSYAPTLCNGESKLVSGGIKVKLFFYFFCIFFFTLLDWTAS